MVYIASCTVHSLSIFIERWKIAARRATEHEGVGAGKEKNRENKQAQIMQESEGPACLGLLPLFAVVFLVEDDILQHATRIKIVSRTGMYM